MGEETHVPAMKLWGYTTGAHNLDEDNFEHLLFCLECQSLMNQFLEVLNGLPKVQPGQAA